MISYNTFISFLKTTKSLFLLFFLFISILFFGSFQDPVSDNPPQGLKVIVLDAGHGGKDPGAVGARSREKDVALQVVLSLGKKNPTRYARSQGYLHKNRRHLSKIV